MKERENCTKDEFMKEFNHKIGELNKTREALRKAMREHEENLRAAEVELQEMLFDALHYKYDFVGIEGMYHLTRAFEKVANETNNLMNLTPHTLPW